MSDEPTTGPATDREIFEDLHKDRHDRLVSSLTGMVRDRDRAEDIASRAFQTAWEKRAQFRGDSSLATWLYAIALNAARQKERGLRVPVERLDTRRQAEPDSHLARLEQDELRALVRKALDRVPDNSRRLLIDRYLNGRSMREIARDEHIPIGTVGSRLFTAHRLLRNAWRATERNGSAMGEERVRQIADEALGRLEAALKAGHSEVLKQYLAAMSRFHRYSWNNVLLIQSQRPTATRVAGYHAWHDLGRFVRKGEKGIVIIAPVLTKEREPRLNAVSREGSEETFRLRGFRTAYVFDVEQTEGRPPPEFSKTTGDPKDYGDKLKAIVANRGISVEYDATIAPALGVSTGGRIRLMPGLSIAEEFSVLAHELAHEMLHHGADRGALPKVVRETQAEAVAFVVSHAVGLETRTAAADYIALYDGDSKTLTESLAAIQEAASGVLKDLLPQERTSLDPGRTSSNAPSERKPLEGSVERDVSKPAAERSAAGPTQTDSIALDR